MGCCYAERQPEEESQRCAAEVVDAREVSIYASSIHGIYAVRGYIPVSLKPFLLKVEESELMRWRAEAKGEKLLEAGASSSASNQQEASQ